MIKNEVQDSVDLHVHTNFSDSTLSPAEVVDYAVSAGLKAVAITDHDVVEAISIVEQLGQKRGLEVVPGVELTADSEGTEIHILGYFIDYTQSWFLDKLKEICQVRHERIHRIVEKLKDLGVDLQARDIFEYAGQGSAGRVHVAKVMVEQGYVNNFNEAFNKFISNSGPAYVSKYNLSPAEAIDLIRQAKGVPVLAHPYIMGDDDAIPDYAAQGLMGIEAFHLTHSPNVREYYKNIAQKHNLVVTGGSDCHGLAKGEVYIGKVRVDYSVVEELRALSGNYEQSSIG